MARDIINENLAQLRDISQIPVDDLSDEQLVRQTSGRIYAIALIDTLFAQLQMMSDNYESYMLDQASQEDEHVVHQ